MKIGMISLGCPKNLVDSEVMLGLAQQAGHELTRDAGAADVLVVNTCAFIDKAKQESIDAILEMAEHKKHGRCRRLVVTGCMAERYRDELRAADSGDRRPARHRAGSGDCRSDRTGPLRGTRPTCRSCARMVNRSHPSGPHPAPSPIPHRRPSPPAYLHLRRRDAAPAGHAAALRVPQDRRRLRLQVRVLHHPDTPRPLPQPAGRVDRA